MRELPGKARGVDEVRLAGHGEELRRRGGGVGVEPGRRRAEALGHDHLLAKALVGRPPQRGPQAPRVRAGAAAQQPAPQRRAAVGAAALHVHLVDKLVDDDVEAFAGRGAGVAHGAPAQHQRAAVHGLAGQHLAVLVHDASAVHGFAASHHVVRLQHDADEIVVPGERAFRLVGATQPQERQAGLCSHGQRHGVGHLQAVRAGEFLVGQEVAHQPFEPCQRRGGQGGDERVVRQRGLPQRPGHGRRGRQAAQPARGAVQEARSHRPQVGAGSPRFKSWRPGGVTPRPRRG